MPAEGAKPSNGSVIKRTGDSFQRMRMEPEGNKCHPLKEASSCATFGHLGFHFIENDYPTQPLHLLLITITGAYRPAFLPATSLLDLQGTMRVEVRDTEILAHTPSSTVPGWSWEFGKLQDSSRTSTILFANWGNASAFLRGLPWSTQHRACCAMNRQSTVSNIVTVRCCACKNPSGAPLDFGPQQTKVKCVSSLTQHRKRRHLQQ